MTILKVQFNDEIRRVTIEDDCDLTELTSKVRYMFPQLRNFVISYFVPSSTVSAESSNSSSWAEIKSNEDLSVGVHNAKLSVPPVFRICIKPVDEPIQPLLETPEPVPVVTTTTAVVLPLCSTCELNEAAYKCINCYNLELCNTCEGAHDSNHLLIKMKNFNAETIESLPLKQQLIFTQHVDNFPSESAKADCKARSKAIRSAIREACNTRKQHHRKSKSCKSSKTATGTSVASVATVEVVAMEPCQTAVIEMAPQIVQLEEMVDPLPQPIVPEDEEKIVVVEVVSEGVPDVEELKEEVKEQEEEQEEEEIEEEEVIAQPEQEEEEEEEGEGWNLMSRLNGWRRGGGNGVDEREYRIQGIGFWEKMEKLEKMGFEDRSKNMLLLAKNLCNLEKTVEDLTC